MWLALVCCSKSDPPKSRRVEDRANPTPASKDFDRLQREASALRDLACACTDHQCFADVASQKVNPFIDGNARQLESLDEKESKAIQRLILDALSNCERKARTISIPTVTVTNECFMNSPAGGGLSFHVIMDEERPATGNGTPTSSRTIYNVRCLGNEGCSGVTAGLEPTDGGGYAIANVSTAPMNDVRVASVSNGIAVLTWGIHTFIFDANKGTVDHRAESGSHGTADCVPLLGR